jgi:hypothetical protein
MSRVSVNRDDPLYKYAIKYMETTWGVNRRFPGCQPVSIEYKHFDILRKNEYVVCEKTDGTRFMMLSFMYENTKVSVFVNRALDMYLCNLNFRRPIYNGTILEGEMYGDTFMIYDCLIDSGTPIGHEDFITRLKHCENVSKKLLSLKTDEIKLRVKTFHLLTDFDSFLNEYLPTVTQDIDGLVFTPIFCPIKIGTHETMFKWKPKNKNTIDFQMKKVNDEWRLYVQDKGELIFESIIPPNMMDESQFYQNAIVECEYVTDSVPMWWRPIKFRTDKTYANSRRTFYRTLVNIKEDIQITDFLKCM